jgi:4-azaleucine resistance transporter AzlC
VLGYGPIGFAFGVIARSSGLSPWEVAAMSTFVYAGSSQFIGAGMIAAGASLVAIAATTFLVNLRHLLMSASLAPHLKGASNGALAAVAYGITDETFAVSSGLLRSKRLSPSFFLGLQVTSQTAWVVSSVSGSLLAGLIPDTAAWGLDFALPAMFIALLILQFRDQRGVIVALASAAVSVAIYLAVPGNWNVIAATLAGATLGVLLNR